MDELEAATVIEGDAAATVADAAKKSKARGAQKWETEARDRLKAAIRRYSKPLADLVARDANEGDTRLLVTDFLCDGLGFDKYADLTTEYGSTRPKSSGCSATRSFAPAAFKGKADTKPGQTTAASLPGGGGPPRARPASPGRRLKMK
jgi:hypothetical protein